MGEVLRLPALAKPADGFRRRYDQTTYGIDEYLQGIDSDPWQGQNGLGLRIPPLATSDIYTRYLFVTNVQKLNAGQKILVRGLGTGWNLGNLNAPEGGLRSVNELAVKTPGYRGNDFNVSFHFRWMSLGAASRRNIGPLDTSNFSQNWADGPALLYQAAQFKSGGLSSNGRPTYYTKLTRYTPPNGGRPWGDPLAPGLGTVLSNEWPIDQASAWNSLNIVKEGPGAIVVFASVRQSDTTTRPTPQAPQANYYQAPAPEDQFLLAYPGAIPWRVYTRLITEDITDE